MMSEYKNKALLIVVLIGVVFPTGISSLRVAIDGYSGHLHVGDNLTLTCRPLGGEIGVNVMWSFTADGSSEQYIVSIVQEMRKDNVDRSDAGEYVCDATSIVSEARASISVVIARHDTPFAYEHNSGVNLRYKQFPEGVITATAVVVTLAVISLLVFVGVFFWYRQKKTPVSFE